MEYVESEAFLAHAGRLKIVPDWRYADPRYLVYSADPDLGRFWEKPAEPSRLAVLIGAVLDGLGPWAACDLWPRGGWRGVADDPGRPADQSLHGWMYRGAGVRADHRGAIRYAVAERPALTAAMFAAAAFGMSVAHDVFVVPDHGRQMVMVDHHDAVHVSFADPSGVAPFVAHMADRRFPLPDDVPDATFKRSGWMP